MDWWCIDVDIDGVLTRMVHRWGINGEGGVSMGGDV
jgi:hypothetical protein